MQADVTISEHTRREIESRLTAIAAEYGVEIVYAIESGSRAWGFPSPDSDYDVRFIYRHPWHWYLSLEEGRDVVETEIEASPAGLLDMGGWDLRKTLRLISKSNPVIWEWLQSPIVYYDSGMQSFRQCRALFDTFYSSITACYHYLSLCRNTMNSSLQGSEVKIKKYFYMLRPLLAAAWIERYRSVPPMELSLLLALLDDRPEIKAQITSLQIRKQSIDEQIPIVRIASIDDFLVEESERLQRAAKSLPARNGDKAALDVLFRQYLGL